MEDEAYVNISSYVKAELHIFIVAKFLSGRIYLGY